MSDGIRRWRLFGSAFGWTQAKNVNRFKMIETAPVPFLNPYLLRLMTFAKSKKGSRALATQPTFAPRR